MRIMRDSTTPGDIPTAGLQLVAGYADGTYDWTPAGWARFPGIPHVTIDVNGSDPEADARDWENGDKAGSLEQWVIDHNNHTGHNDAVVYCNRSTIPEVRRLTGSQILGHDYWLWVATLDGTQVLADMHGVVAVQDKGEAQTGGHYDESVVYADWWMASVPPVPPVPAQREYIVVELPGGLTFKAVSGQVLK